MELVNLFDSAVIIFNEPIKFSSIIQFRLFEI